MIAIESLVLVGIHALVAMCLAYLIRKIKPREW